MDKNNIFINITTIIVIMIIVKRFCELKRLRKAGPPLLVYGRRKTGKTFLIKNFFPKALYFFVRRDKSIYYEKRNELITYDELVRILDEHKEKIIVDEFHRLPEGFLDYLHIKAPKNVILVTSTLNLTKKLLSSKSPILGLFLEFRLNIIDERDCLLTLKDYIKDNKKLVEYCAYLREPILLRFFKNDLVSILNGVKLTVPALIGEIFTEEEKELSARYEAILRAVSIGKNTLAETTAFLYSHKTIKKQDISAVKPYIKTLTELGLVKRIPEYSSKRNYYLISSPMISLYYYLDEKYNFSEKEIKEEYVDEKTPLHVEDFFRELFSKIFNKRIFSINKPDMEIDIALGDFKKLKIVGEVKWKKRISKKEIKLMERKLNKFENCRKILIVPNKKILENLPKKIEVLDVKKILEIISKHSN